jgi:hypothetical protein
MNGESPLKVEMFTDNPSLLENLEQLIKKLKSDETVKLSVYPAITLEALNKHLSEKPLVTVTNKQIGYCEITADSTLVPHENGNLQEGGCGC